VIPQEAEPYGRGTSRGRDVSYPKGFETILVVAFRAPSPGIFAGGVSGPLAPGLALPLFAARKGPVQECLIRFAGILFHCGLLRAVASVSSVTLGS